MISSIEIRPLRRFSMYTSRRPPARHMRLLFSRKPNRKPGISPAHINITPPIKSTRALDPAAPAVVRATTPTQPVPAVSADVPSEREKTETARAASASSDSSSLIIIIFMHDTRERKKFKQHFSASPTPPPPRRITEKNENDPIHKRFWRKSFHAAPSLWITPYF